MSPEQQKQKQNKTRIFLLRNPRASDPPSLMACTICSDEPVVPLAERMRSPTWQRGWHMGAAVCFHVFFFFNSFVFLLLLSFSICFAVFISSKHLLLSFLFSSIFPKLIVALSLCAVELLERLSYVQSFCLPCCRLKVFSRLIGRFCMASWPSCSLSKSKQWSSHFDFPKRKNLPRLLEEKHHFNFEALRKDQNKGPNTFGFSLIDTMKRPRLLPWGSDRDSSRSIGWQRPLQETTTSRDPPEAAVRDFSGECLCRTKGRKHQKEEHLLVFKGFFDRFFAITPTVPKG